LIKGTIFIKGIMLKFTTVFVVTQAQHQGTKSYICRHNSFNFNFFLRLFVFILFFNLQLLTNKHFF